MAEYEYEYDSVWKNHPNTNTNNSIRPQLFKWYSNTEFSVLGIFVFVFCICIFCGGLNSGISIIPIKPIIVLIRICSLTLITVRMNRWYDGNVIRVAAHSNQNKISPSGALLTTYYLLPDSQDKEEEDDS